jgi:hypothetical protein
LGTHWLQPPILALQPGAPHAVSAKPLPAALQVTEVIGSEQSRNMFAVHSHVPVPVQRPRSEHVWPFGQSELDVHVTVQDEGFVCEQSNNVKLKATMTTNFNIHTS